VKRGPGRPRKHPPRTPSVEDPFIRRQLENLIAYHLERCLAARYGCLVSAKIPLLGELLKLAFVALCEENIVDYSVVKPSKKPEKVIIYDTAKLRKRLKIRSNKQLFRLAAHLADRALQAYRKSRRLKTSPVRLIAGERDVYVGKKAASKQ